MATRKDRKSKTEPRSKQRKSKFAGECAFPSEQERLPLHIPGTYQVAMGTGEEIVAWLREVPRNTQAILITFSNEARYRMYGPILWHVAHKLPEIVAHIQRRRFEQLVDAVTQLLLARPGAVSAAVSGAKVTSAKGALPRRWRGMPNERKGEDSYGSS
jgi:hypothetical protein